MRRASILAIAIVAVIVTVCAMAAAQTQSEPLGDYARSVRKSKPQDAKTAKVYDNDNMPSSTTISVVGDTSKGSADASKEKDANTQTDANGNNSSTDPKSQENAKDKTASSDSKPQDSADAKKKGEIKPGQTLDERRAAYDVWTKRLDEQKKKVDQLARDLDDFQHHSLMPQVDDWTANAKYKQGVIDRQKTLDQAKDELNDLQEQARKAGVPASVAE